LSIEDTGDVGAQTARTELKHLKQQQREAHERTQDAQIQELRTELAELHKMLFDPKDGYVLIWEKNKDTVLALTRIGWTVVGEVGGAVTGAMLTLAFGG
jgi:hypothetical protein